MDMNGKVVFITGGGSGMGQLAARNLAAKGAVIAAVDVNEAGLAKTAEAQPNVHTYTVDVTDADAVQRTVDEVESKLGPIARVYNAAAIMPLGKLMDQDLGLIKKIMDINYGGVVNVTKATMPGMLKRRSGDMIIFASMAGWVPVLLVGAYNASKFAVVAFTEVLAHENRNSGVRIACVCPPPVATPLLDKDKQTVWPKIFDAGPPLDPQEVLDEIEKSLDAGQLFVLPGKGTKQAWRARRWAPNFLWKQVHKAEGW